MASSTDYLEFVLDLLRDVPAVTNRKMMGEYLLYSDGVLFGGIYAMLLVDSEDPACIAEAVAAMLAELPKPKRKR